jgi:hypothetical protein
MLPAKSPERPLHNNIVVGTKNVKLMVLPRKGKCDE